MRARVAELGRGWQRRPAVRAGPGQRGRALFAETRPLRVVVLAPGTLHRLLPRAGARLRARATRTAYGLHGQSADLSASGRCSSCT